MLQQWHTFKPKMVVIDSHASYPLLLSFSHESIFVIVFSCICEIQLLCLCMPQTVSVSKSIKNATRNKKVENYHSFYIVTDFQLKQVTFTDCNMIFNGILSLQQRLRHRRRRRPQCWFLFGQAIITTCRRLRLRLYYLCFLFSIFSVDHNICAIWNDLPGH